MLACGDRLDRMRAALAICFTLLLCACLRLATWYAPPAQFTPFTGPAAVVEVRKIVIKDPDAAFNVLDGVYEVGREAEFSWTSEHIRVQLAAGDVANNDFFMHYATVEKTLRKTGPVRITITIGGKTFDSFVQGDDGIHLYKHPAGGISNNEVRTMNVDVTIDPPWIAPDGTKLGFLIESIGFMPSR